MRRSQNGTRKIAGKLCLLGGRSEGPFAKENAERERIAMLRSWETVHIVKRDRFGWDYALYVFGYKGDSA